MCRLHTIPTNMTAFYPALVDVTDGDKTFVITRLANCFCNEPTQSAKIPPRKKYHLKYDTAWLTFSVCMSIFNCNDTT